MNKNIICIVVCVLAILLMTVLDSRGQIGITGNAAFVGAAGFSAASGGAACSTVATNRLGDTTISTLSSIGRFNSFTNASFFIPSSTFTGCKIRIAVSKTGSPMFNLTSCILADDGASPSHPAAPLQASPDTVSASTISTSDPTESYVEFSYSGQTFTSGIKYWISIKASATDSSNYVNLYTSGGYAGFSSQDLNASWGETSGYKFKFEIFQ